MDELAAEVLGPVVVEQDRRRCPRRATRRSPSSVTRSWASAAHAQASIASGRQPGPRRSSLGREARRGRRRAARANRPELEAEVDEPRAVEPAEAGDRGRRSGRRGPSSGDCRMRRRPLGCRPRYGTVPVGRACNGRARSPGSGGRWIPTAAHRRPAARPRRIVRGARPGPPGPALLDRAADARRPARRRGGRPGRLRPGLPGARRLRRGADPRPAPPAVAGDDRPQPVPLAARRGGRAAARTPLSLDLAPARRARAAHRRRPRARPPPRRGRRQRERLGRPPADPAARLSQRRRAPPRRRPVAIPSSPPPSTDPRAPSRPRSTAAWPCCARRSRPPSGTNARR